MVCHGAFFVEGIFHIVPDRLFFAPKPAGEGNIEHQIHMPPALDHPEVVKLQPVIPVPEQVRAGLLQSVQFRVVGDHRIIMDHQMDIVGAQAPPFHLVDDVVAGQGILPMGSTKSKR